MNDDLLGRRHGLGPWGCWASAVLMLGTCAATIPRWSDLGELSDLGSWAGGGDIGGGRRKGPTFSIRLITRRSVEKVKKWGKIWQSGASGRSGVGYGETDKTPNRGKVGGNAQNEVN